MLDCWSQTRRFVIPFTKSISRLPHKICPSTPLPPPRLRKETSSLNQDYSATAVYSYRVCTAVRFLVKISRINTSVNYGPSWVISIDLEIGREKTIASPHQSLAFRARLCAKIRKIEAPLPSPCTAFSQAVLVNAFRWRIRDLLNTLTMSTLFSPQRQLISFGYTRQT